ncbi:MAG: hypothetical protein HFG08_09755 [Oscillibacter sp.]|nr:hypothetical protein [Oscillibacter sp.]
MTKKGKTRMPSGRAKRCRPRARVAPVKGLGFYRKAHGEAETIAPREAEDFLGRLTAMELK